VYLWRNFAARQLTVMSTDPPDDDDRALDLPDGLDLNNLLPPELQAEHDRLLAELEAEVPAPVRLDPDLEELEHKIGDVRFLRKMGIENVKPYMFGRFEAITTMRGGIGLVIKARDPQLEREVAIKLGMRSGPEAQAALLTEARTLAKFKHPNVVTVHEPGIWNDRVYFVMEWIEGVDGHDWMDEPRWWREVRDVYLAAGTGLAAAHDAGIQHRDFKPSNILIGNDGRVVVADFGVADSLPSSPDRDEFGKAAGTASYMAPERLRGKQGDARSDQFSFCVSIWRALYRQRPYAGETSEQVLGSIERGEIRESPGVRVPAWLSAVVRKGLADDPDQRYSNMHELLKALRDEPSTSDATDDELDDDDGPLEVDGRVLHTPDKRAPSGVFVMGDKPLSKPEHDDEDGDDGAIELPGPVNHGPAREGQGRWGYFATALVSSTITLLGIGMLTWSPTPEPAVGIVEAEAYTVILGLIAADKSTEAKQVWRDHALDLTDEQSLQIARDWLARAREEASSERTKAQEAASAALDVADRVQQNGSSRETKTAGGQLAAEAKIYERIAADEFAQAQQTWLDHESKLTDDQSLQLAKDCLDRAEQLADVAREEARAAALAAREIANETASFGVTEESKEKGGQLDADATAFLVNHPGVDAD
jgi:serine/threonine protein kinase